MIYHSSVSHVVIIIVSLQGLSLMRHMSVYMLINPRRACAARVTVLGLSVCLSVCLSPLQLAPRRSVRSTNDTIYSAGNSLIKGFFLKRLRCGDQHLPLLNGLLQSAILCAENNAHELTHALTGDIGAYLRMYASLRVYVARETVTNMPTVPMVSTLVPSINYVAEEALAL